MATAAAAPGSGWWGRPGGPTHRLRAGPVELELKEAELRHLRVGGTELIQRVYFGLRASDWDTPCPEVTSLAVDDRRESFTARLEARVALPAQGVDYAWRMVVEGGADGSVGVRVESEALAGFDTPRIGLCVLYPQELGGTPFELTAADGGAAAPGSLLAGDFPITVSPGMIATEYSALSFRAAGVSVATELDGTGSSFMMEDQRNFGDSSFKAFTECHNTQPGVFFVPEWDESRPTLYNMSPDRTTLHRGDAGPVRAGDAASQTLTLRFRPGVPPPAAALAADVTTLAVGGALAGPLPAMELGADASRPGADSFATLNRDRKLQRFRFG